jgi:trans-aconitate methyltransferase
MSPSRSATAAPLALVPPPPPEDAHRWRFDALSSVRDRDTAVLDALPRVRYRRALELGSGIGALTERLQTRCDTLHCVEPSATARARALHRCRPFPHVRFPSVQVPDAWPEGTFDLTLLSGLACHWSPEALELAQRRLLEHLEPGGHLVLVHWSGQTRDMRVSGHEAHDAFRRLTPQRLRHLRGEMDATWRLDVFERL